ncbi:TPA: MGMT family protein [Candidatus Woesearchaeota archaeon]|nr:MGMT family protein [Candidatus Woesearchaeota archaeon]HIH32017.1 MGMT family protein [Candidatus Woesearchaeota archaeon]HIH54444.1 MGMT family protein [Candidatus Woesearchaeota archaeon]HIJ01510.1 MGMT family protein [Candidatus Woesearchaeota archaeon]HIJ13729.1 MGMT family protein [Candidatus Woesearchaeota archaeon]
MINKARLTEFSEKVYAICSKIPKGKVMTYGQIAKILKSSPRAVGQALKHNPYAPKIPCHRVIKSDGTLGGFNGKMHSMKKIKLLRSEGVEVEDFRIDERFIKSD